MKSDYSLTSDPLFYLTVGFFAFFTTGLSAVLGQVRFMPILQAVSLTVFMAIALRRGRINHALLAVGLWLVVQWLVMTTLTWFAVSQVERAISDGFLYRAALAEWFFAGSPLPLSLDSEPAARILEVAGILLGSLVSGGLIGVWFLVRAVNLAGYAAGGLMLVFDGPLAPLAGFLPWTVVRVAGFAGLVVLFAEPLLTGNWSIIRMWSIRRRLLLVSVGLLLLGLLLEMWLPELWRTLFL